MGSFFKKLMVVSIVLLGSEASLACPCGCGAVGPLMLWPGEAWKWQLGLNVEAIDGFIGANGQAGANGGAQSSDSLQLGVAKALSQDLSMSVNVAEKRERHPELGSEWNVQDPSVGLRYIASQVDYGRPWKPQVQLHGTYKQSLQSWRERQGPSKFGVDSSESSELVPGVDLWFNFGEWTLGLSEALLLRRSVLIEQGQSRQLAELGLGHRSSLGFGYTFLGRGQILASLEREGKDQDKLDGLAVADSDRVQNAVSLTANLRLGTRQTLSLNGKFIAMHGQNKNSKRSRALGISYIQAI